MDIINTDSAPAAVGPYSQAIVAGNMVFCSGQIPLSIKGEMITGSIAVETSQVIENLKNVLKAAGTDLLHVVKTTVYLADMNDFLEMNSVYEKYFTGKPARATVEVKALPKGARVEIECIAVKD